MLKNDSNLFFIYSNFATLKVTYNNEVKTKIVIDDSKIKLIPDTKINISQLNVINNV